MKFEDWKEMIQEKSLDALLLWLLDSYERYLKESHEKWQALMHASALTENYKEAVKWEKEEADSQKERYEWLLEFISKKYGIVDKEMEKGE